MNEKAVLLLAALALAAVPAPSRAGETPLLISEIWAAPEEGPEWVELLNPSEEEAPVDSLFLRRNGKRCALGGAPVRAGGRLVLVSDTAAFRELHGPARIDLRRPSCWLSLPNGGGGLALVGPDGGAADSVGWNAVPRGGALERDFSAAGAEEGGRPPAELVRAERATPGFSFRREPRADTLALPLRLFRPGERLPLKLRLESGSALEWEIADLEGKLFGSGRAEGPYDGTLSLPLPGLRGCPLFLLWSLSGGKRGAERVILAR